MKQESKRLYDSLPLFVRIMFLDHPSTWLEEINKFDFFTLISVAPEYDLLIDLSPNQKMVQVLYPYGKEKMHIRLSDFLSLNIIEINGIFYTIKDFCLSLAYNGGLHMIPLEQKHEIIYEEFFIKHEDHAWRLVKQVANCFVDLFSFYEEVLGSLRDGYSFHEGYQPKVIENGKTLEGMQFSNSCMQFAIKRSRRRGIRICMEIRLKNKNSNELLLEFGHRKRSGKIFSIKTSGKFLLFQVSKSNKKMKAIKWKIEEDIYQKFYLLEFAIYPSGTFLFAANNYLKCIDKIGSTFDILIGRLCLGCDLELKEFGSFMVKKIIIQSIDRQHRTLDLNVVGLDEIKTKSLQIPPQIIKREFI
ncbi:hypothetical protein [Phaeodactylibacter xiamenensis]|uniref:hypothetical protein n=1 Tax=Phaeodactylibacter xiamenensis TaxID=1524460 RepID=UPI003BAC570F